MGSPPSPYDDHTKARLVMSRADQTMANHRQRILRTKLIAGNVVDPVADGQQIAPCREVNRPIWSACSVQVRVIVIDCTESRGHISRYVQHEPVVTVTS
jgi:hypothetical protein